jgi:hypothetical protein
LQNSKNSNFELQKNSKNTSVVYHLFNLCVNLYYEIPCIIFSAKITKFQIWEHIFRSRKIFQNLSNSRPAQSGSFMHQGCPLSFLLKLQYKVLHNKNLHDHSIHSKLHLRSYIVYIELQHASSLVLPS